MNPIFNALEDRAKINGVNSGTLGSMIHQGLMGGIPSGQQPLPNPFMYNGLQGMAQAQGQQQQQLVPPGPNFNFSFSNQGMGGGNTGGATGPPSGGISPTPQMAPPPKPVEQPPPYDPFAHGINSSNMGLAQNMIGSGGNVAYNTNGQMGGHSNAGTIQGGTGMQGHSNGLGWMAFM